MKVYHVTTVKKLHKYLAVGYIRPPVRAWKTVEAAERFSVQTGRRIILRLKFNENGARQLFGHKGQAVCSDNPILIRGY